MTTPAIDFTTSLTGTLYGYVKDPGGNFRPNGWVSVTSDVAHRRRPASRTNLFRADHTRAPSSWAHRGWRMGGAVGEEQGSSIFNPLQVHKFVGQVLPPPLASSIPTWGEWSVLLSRAQLKALLNLKNSKVNLGVALGEARKTAELVSSTARTVERQLDNFMAKNWRAVGRMASWKKLPAKYLELSYGWTPLLNDVVGSAETLAERMLNGYDLSYTARGSASSSSEREWREHASVGLGRPAFWTAQVTESHRVALVYTLPNELLQSFQSLGLTNPGELVWELLPYSFILDWLVPVGDWLSVLDAAALATYKEGSHTAVQRVQVTDVRLGSSPYVIGAADNLSVVPSNAFWFNRNAPVGRPSVWSIFPSLRSPLSLDKMAKSLSLLAQTFSKWR